MWQLQKYLIIAYSVPGTLRSPLFMILHNPNKNIMM